MSKIIVITSGKGGVGKTTTAINLGAAMNYFGKNVLIVDANLSTPNIGVHLGSPEVPINLNHILQDKADVFEAVYEHESGIKIIPSSLSIKELSKIKPEKLKSYKKDFKKVSDIVIMDSSAGLGDESINAIKTADEIILVTNPEIPAITDALKTIKLAEQFNKKIIGVIVTRVKKNNIEMNPTTVKDMLEVPVLGMIPEDISIGESLNLKDAVVHTHPKSKVARAYKEIAAQLVGAEYDSDKDKEKLITRILQKIGLKK
ncbi:septum site-determining protein MinD [Candidatus Pacearchaeota archaeon]|nr:MAG: septum site-determining protein MinD [Candidatus Pacearchaeota archaeon]